MTNVHSARPQNGYAPEHAGSPDKILSSTNDTTSASVVVTERNFITCRCCGAQVEEGIDCAAENCPGLPDQRLFAPYMSPYRVYDLTHWLDRWAVRGAIERCLRACVDYQTTYPDRAWQVVNHWRQHMNALSRMDELDQAALPIKEGHRK